MGYLTKYNINKQTQINGTEFLLKGIPINIGYDVNTQWFYITLFVKDECINDIAYQLVIYTDESTIPNNIIDTYKVLDTMIINRTTYCFFYAKETTEKTVDGPKVKTFEMQHLHNVTIPGKPIRAYYNAHLNDYIIDYIEDGHKYYIKRIEHLMRCIDGTPILFHDYKLLETSTIDHIIYKRLTVSYIRGPKEDVVPDIKELLNYNYAEAMGIIIKELGSDRATGSMYHEWQSNLACTIMDTLNINHDAANATAKDFLEKLIDERKE